MKWGNTIDYKINIFNGINRYIFSNYALIRTLYLEIFKNFNKF